VVFGWLYWSFGLKALCWRISRSMLSYSFTLVAQQDDTTGRMIAGVAVAVVALVVFWSIRAMLRDRSSFQRLPGQALYKWRRAFPIQSCRKQRKELGKQPYIAAAICTQNLYRPDHPAPGEEVSWRISRPSLISLPR
jgi:hypothetical protein